MSLVCSQNKWRDTVKEKRQNIDKVHVYARIKMLLNIQMHLWYRLYRILQ